MHFDLFSIQCVMAVVQTGSFTRAAQRMGRTQSAISQQIAKLEDSLGKALIVRGVEATLTPDGEVFLSYGRKMLALYEETLTRFKEPDLKGEIKFGLPENFATLFLSDVLATFSRDHPGILLNVECDLTLNLFERFKKNEFDLVLVKMTAPEGFPNGQDVWSEPLEWVGSMSSFSANTPIPLVLSPSPCVYRASALCALEASHIPWRLVFSSTSFASTVAAVKSGMGVSVMPRTNIPKDLAPLKDPSLPKLPDAHVSLIKHVRDNQAINALEGYVMHKMKMS